VRWPFNARVDSVAAWGVVASGIAIAGIMMTVLDGNHGHLWWWPTSWMYGPSAIVAIGLAMAVVPLRHRGDHPDRQMSPGDRQVIKSSSGSFVLGRGARMKARDIFVLASPAPTPNSMSSQRHHQAAGYTGRPEVPLSVRNHGPLPRVRDLSPPDVGVRRSGVWAVDDPLHGLAADIGPSPADHAATYVPRRHDTEFRRQLADAAARGNGLVWLVGRSCTGKTRSAWEAIAEGFGDWTFADCRDPAILTRLLSGREGGDGDIIIWLDDVHLLHAAATLARPLQALFDHCGQSRVIAVATSWPTRDEEGRETEDENDGSCTEELAELKKLAAAIVNVHEGWYTDEIDRARAAATKDHLLKAALNDETFSPPQVLAGTRWAFDLWENPHNRETRALLTAAIDLSRLLTGHQAQTPMLSAALLEESAPFYLTRPPADPSWFNNSLRDATTPCRDAVWALIPRGESFQLFRPLLDYGQRVRSWELIPHGVWDALSRARLDRVALGGLRASAHNRLLYELETRFGRAQKTAPERTVSPEPMSVRTDTPAPPDEGTQRQSASSISVRLDTSDRVLADQLLGAGDIAGLRALAVPSNDPYVRRRLAMYYVRQHDLSSLRDLATFSKKACRELAELLARDGEIDELLHQIVCGNGFARRALESWPIKGLPDSERARIIQNGLNTDGTIASERRRHRISAFFRHARPFVA
jgi:hypothetical protein